MEGEGLWGERGGRFGEGRGGLWGRLVGVREGCRFFFCVFFVEGCVFVCFCVFLACLMFFCVFLVCFVDVWFCECFVELCMWGVVRFLWERKGIVGEVCVRGRGCFFSVCVWILFV